ncbi:CYTH and CHAD domain-containing protein [Nocardiopsis sp. CNT312]|uniref:CYTH and CHAD domain-containing protein n=1 Tax=Nocardiopsis sp. CNT312 TaxID=1137268 RepID=UPI00049005D9|nr:CYTH and CHAD domain-containing protein [Nocardiopsis sp. CNT312]
MNDHLEVETTFAMDGDLPDLSGTTPGGVRSEAFRLEATYYDTAGLRLAARGITCRRRTGGSDAGWHLKVPWGEGTRRELHAPLSCDPPANFVGLSAAAARGAPLLPVARIDTERTEHRLEDEDGAALVVVADDHVTSRDLAPRTADGTVGAEDSWREVEAELADGDRSDLDRVTAVLTRSGARPAEYPSKLRRALGHRLPPPLPRHPGSGDAATVLAHLARYTDRLLAFDPLVRRFEPDAVHQMRVTSRRLRSALTGFRSVLRRSQTRPVADELRHLAAVLGEVRDLEVLRERWTAHLERLPDHLVGRDRSGVWLTYLDERMERARSEVDAFLNSPRYFALLDSLDTLLAAPPLRKKAARGNTDLLARDITRACARLRDRHDAALAADAAGDPQQRAAAWHEVRKSAKRVRYAARMAQSGLGKPAKRLGKWARDLQDVLGRYQDGRVGLAYLDTVGDDLIRTQPDDRESVLLTLGAVAGLEAAGGEGLLDEAEHVWGSGSRLWT